jgi:hypothetical protein
MTGLAVVTENFAGRIALYHFSLNAGKPKHVNKFWMLDCPRLAHFSLA